MTLRNKEQPAAYVRTVYRCEPYQDQEDSFFTPIWSRYHPVPQSFKKRSASGAASSKSRTTTPSMSMEREETRNIFKFVDQWLGWKAIQYLTLFQTALGQIWPGLFKGYLPKNVDSPDQLDHYCSLLQSDSPDQVDQYPSVLQMRWRLIPLTRWISIILYCRWGKGWLAWPSWSVFFCIADEVKVDSPDQVDLYSSVLQMRWRLTPLTRLISILLHYRWGEGWLAWPGWLVFFCIADEVKVDSPDQPGKGQIIAFTVWGILRGLETFRQINELLHYYWNNFSKKWVYFLI